MNQDLARHITDATTSAAALTTSAIYSYVATRDFFLSLVVVSIFSMLGYIYNLIQDLKNKPVQQIEIEGYIKIAIKGFITSGFIAVLTLIICSYYAIDPAITLIVSIVLGAKPDIVKNILTIIGHNVEAIVKWRIKKDLE